MKRLHSRVWLCVPLFVAAAHYAAAPATAAPGDAAVAPEPLRFTVDIPRPKAVMRDGATAFQIDGFGSTSAAWMPIVPFRRLHFEIPYHATAVRAFLVGVESESLGTVPSIALRHPAMPGTQPPSGDAEPSEPRPALPPLYPTEPFRDEGLNEVKGHRLATVALWPVQYDSATCEATYHRRFTIVVEPVLDSARAAFLTEVPSTKTPAFEALARSMIFNYAPDPAIEPAAREAHSLQAVDGSLLGAAPSSQVTVDCLAIGDLRYAIICRSGMGASALAKLVEFADWKTKTGTPAYLQTMADVAANYGNLGSDTPQDVRYALEYIWWGGKHQSVNYDWALLVGDHDQVNKRNVKETWWTKKTTILGFTFEEKDQDSLPSDYYFADITDPNYAHTAGQTHGYDWDTDNDGTYGEFADDLNWIPELYVGRWTMSDDNISPMVNITIDYEKGTHVSNPNIPTTWTKRAVLAGGKWDDKTDGADTEEEIRNDLLAGSGITTVRRLYYLENWTRDRGLNEDILEEEVGKGCVMLDWDGHGSETGAWTKQSGGSAFVTTDTSPTGTVRTFPVVYSNSCSTGHFDRDGNCLAEDVLRDWAIAVIASSRVEYYCIDWTDETDPWGQTSDYLFWKEILKNGKTRVGQALYDSKVAYCNLVDGGGTDVDVDGGSRKNVLEYNLFGDPELDMWTDQPTALTVSTPGFSAKRKYFDVQVKNSAGAALPGAVVTLWKKNSGLDSDWWGSGVTDASGLIRFNFSEAVTATFDLTVTAHNYLPYLGSVSIAYTDTTPPYGVSVNHWDGQYLKANPVLNIDFDDNSDLDQVFYKVDAAGSWVPIAAGIAGPSYTASWSMTAGVWSGLSQGLHTLCFRLIDDAGNETIATGEGNTFQFGKDTISPSPVSSLSAKGHSAGGYSNDNTIEVIWGLASDATSGVHGYSYEWSASSWKTPDTTEDVEDPLSSVTSSALADGDWYFHIAAGDTVVVLDGALDSNWGVAQHLGPFRIDTVKPAAPKFNTTSGNWYSAAPALDIDFRDAVELYMAAWKKKGAPGWTLIASGIDGTDYTTNWTMGSGDWSGLGEGTSLIYFKVQDDAGNAYETPNDAAAFSVVRDVTAPTATYNSAEGQFFSGTPPTLDIDFADRVGAANGKLDLIRYKFGTGGSWATVAQDVGAHSYTADWQVDANRWSGLPDGTYYIYFEVSDLADNRTTTTGNAGAFEIRKDTLPPTAKATIGNQGLIKEGDTVTLDGSGSSDANGIVRYEWDFGDGSGKYSETAASAPDGLFDGVTTHVYASRGTHTATLTVFDPPGNSAKTTAAVRVKAKPAASIDSISPSPAIGGQSAGFNGSGTDPDGDAIMGYAWRSDRDGALAATSSFSTQKLSPSDTAAHTISLKVQDSDGLWSDEVTSLLWVYVPKPWPMYKYDDARHGAQATYLGIAHGQQGFAQSWTYLANSAVTGSPASANLDGDWTNGLETAFASSGAAGRLCVVDRAGSLLWSAAIAASRSAPALEDIDQDGNLDVVVGSSTGVHAYDGNGNWMWTFAPAGAPSFATCSPVAADIDGNPGNGLETVAAAGDGNVYAIRGNGGQFWKFDPTPAGAMPFTASAAVAEIDGMNAGMETVIGGTDGVIYVVSAGGAQLAAFATPAPPVRPIDTTAAIDDLVPANLGRPGPEIVFGSDDGHLYCLNYRPGVLAVAWQYPAAGQPPLAAIDSSPAVGAVGESGDRNVIFGCDNGNVYVLRADTGALDSMFACGGGVQVNSTPAIANIDTVLFIHPQFGDLPEVIVGASNGNLYALSFSMGGQNLPWSPLPLAPGGAVESSPAVADIDHNPELEILVGASDSRLHHIRAGAAGGPNLNPVAIPRPINLGVMGQPLTLDGSGSYDPDEPADSIVKWEWSIPAGSPAPFVAHDAEAAIDWPELMSRGISVPGDYAAELRVYDSLGASSAPAMTMLAIRPGVDPPNADAGGPYELYAGQALALDATGSSAAEAGNEIVRYEWDFDFDGAYGDGSGAQAVLGWEELAGWGLDAAGAHAIRVRVTDRLGQTADSPAGTVTVLENHAPTADAGGPYSIEEGQSVNVTATGTDPDTGDTIVLYEWDFDCDGVYGEYTGQAVTVPWSYLAGACHGRGDDGPNPIGVRVTDSHGACGTSQTALLFIYEIGPVAVPRANGAPDAITVAVGEPVTFDHVESYHHWPAGHGIVLYEWDFDGDGTYDWSTAEPARERSHSYGALGSFQARLRVTDDHIPPRSDVASIEILTDNLPPVALMDEPQGGYVVPVGQGLALDGSQSYDPDGAIAGHWWDLDGDGEYGDRTGPLVALTWGDLDRLGLTDTARLYSIWLRVIDLEGRGGERMASLQIARAAVEADAFGAGALYSDGGACSVTVHDAAGQALLRQAARPKDFFLELERSGGAWCLLDSDRLDSTDDTDRLLEFAFAIPGGGVDPEPGSHRMRLRFNGDQDYLALVAEGTLVLGKEAARIGAPAAAAVYGGDVAVEVVLEDDDARPLLHQGDAPKPALLEVLDRGAWWRLGDDALAAPDDGDTTLHFAGEIGPLGVDLTGGVYAMRASFAGDTYYSGATATGELTVLPRPVEFVDDIDLPVADWQWACVYSDPVTVRARLVDDRDRALAHQADEPKEIHLEAQGQSGWVRIASARLESPDDAESQLVFVGEVREGAADLLPGVRPLRLRFDGDGRYAAGLALGTLALEREATQLIDDSGLWSWTITEGSGQSLLIRLVDGDEERLAHIGDGSKVVYVDVMQGGVWVNFAIGRLDYVSAVAGSPREEPALSFDWDRGPGTFAIRFRFEGDPYYTPCSATGALTVLPRPLPPEITELTVAPALVPGSCLIAVEWISDPGRYTAFGIETAEDPGAEAGWTEVARFPASGAPIERWEGLIPCPLPVTVLRLFGVP